MDWCLDSFGFALLVKFWIKPCRKEAGEHYTVFAAFFPHYHTAKRRLQLTVGGYLTQWRPGSRMSVQTLLLLCMTQTVLDSLLSTSEPSTPQL